MYSLDKTRTLVRKLTLGDGLHHGLGGRIGDDGSSLGGGSSFGLGGGSSGWCSQNWSGLGGGLSSSGSYSRCLSGSRSDQRLGSGLDSRSADDDGLLDFRHGGYDA
jgi:hypothetical protein